MPATRKKCQAYKCKKFFWACRSDALYCSEKCAGSVKMENAKFEYPKIPRSGFQGITFNRLIRRWQAKHNRKYLASFKTIEECKVFLIEFLGREPKRQKNMKPLNEGIKE